MEQEADRQPPTFHALVVEDNMMNRIVLSSMLTLRGYRVTEVGSADAAWPIVESNHFDLVMLDIMMPGTSGLAFCRRLRERPELAKLPVIAYTALSDSETLAEIARAGFNEVLVKPLEGAVLDRLIEKVGIPSRPRHPGRFQPAQG